jgi:hypothetical protein
VNKKRKVGFTAEIAEDAEGKKYNAFVVSGAASLLLAFLSGLRGESKFSLTAEHAETAEFKTTKAQNKDIFLLVLVFLAQPAYCLLFSALSAISAVNYYNLCCQNI